MKLTEPRFAIMIKGLSQPSNRIAMCLLLIMLVFTGLLMNSCTSTNANNTSIKKRFVLDMVHHNPGEEPIESNFNNPQYLANYGYTGQVVNDFIFIHSTVTFDKLSKNIFPMGSPERAWLNRASTKIQNRIKSAHEAGIEIYYFMDLIVLPKKIVEIYGSEILDSNGKIDIHKSKTQEIHRLMLNEIFEKYPDLDGLVIRTGETYLHNVPHHTGNNPILRKEESHKVLINILREEVCEKYNKKIFYRTWDFGWFHTDPVFYKNVTDAIESHENLIFSIKHTKGDYHRTYKFNPTLGIGKHKQIVEVQCQREYEGKGAHPNYVMDGVINGFEEYANDLSPQSLSDLSDNPNFAGVWTWSRGGGWVGPYIQNELWCELNAYVMSAWANDPNSAEEQIFNSYMDKLGLEGESRVQFRELCLLSAKGVVRGHSSLKLPINVWWMRDQFMGGMDLLKEDFDTIISKNMVEEILMEKEESAKIWDNIYLTAETIYLPDAQMMEYIKVSSKYGQLKYNIIKEGWTIMLLGYAGDLSGDLDMVRIQKSIERYDELWQAFEDLKENNVQCATLYKPYSFYFQSPNYHLTMGMDSSVNYYRNKLAN